VPLDDLFGWLAGVIFVSRLIPQPLKIWRTGERAGVSWLALANGIVSTAGWLAYGLMIDRPVLWVPSLVALVPEVVVLVLLGLRPPDRRALLAWLAWAGAVLVSWPIAGEAGLGTVIAFGVVVGVVPAVIAALRTDRPTGIAVRTWQIALLDAVLWGTYGIATSEPLTTFYGIVLTTGATIILVRVARLTRAADGTVIGPEPDGSPAPEPAV
jgi:uncharacterized protein with PQ loop repeat